MSRQALYESMSRLLDGELTGPETDALRQRIAGDPELARALETMEQLRGRVGELPEAHPPAHLDETALEVMQRITSPAAAEIRPPAGVPIAGPSGRRVDRDGRWRSWMLAPLAAGVALAALLWWPSAPPTLVLLEGSRLVEGRAVLLAGAVPIDIDGKVRVTVEPVDASFRDMDQEVLMRNRDLLLGALAGAAITVAVYEGSAVIFPGEASSRTLGPDQTETIVHPGPRATSPEVPGSAESRNPLHKSSSWSSTDSQPEPFDDEFDRVVAEADEEAFEEAAPETGEVPEPSEEGAEPEVLYSTSKEGINDAIRERLSEIRECYQAWLELQPDLEGTVEVKFVISDVDGVGEVTRTETLDTTTTDHTLFEGCVLNVMSTLAFESPEDGGVVIVSYPFQFTAG